MAKTAVRGLSFAEYLAMEAESEIKHEYYAGEMFAMAGGTVRHARLIARVTMCFGNALEGRPCQPYTTELRVRVEETGLATYPDLSIVCGAPETDPEDDETVTNPTVLVEVLSPSTEGYDRGTKFKNYRALPSLQDYVLVSQSEPLIEVYHRQPGEVWSYQAFGPGRVVPLPSIGIQIAVDDVYRGVKVPPP